jgi:hypothetical protein
MIKGFAELDEAVTRGQTHRRASLAMRRVFHALTN